jgi:DNA mismatch repair ATPase MutS
MASTGLISRGHFLLWEGLKVILPSVLFVDSVRTIQVSQETLRDLRLDRVVREIVQERNDILEYYLSPVQDEKTVRYRQEVMKDLENNEKLLEAIRKFAKDMASFHRHMKMVEQLEYEYNRKGWFLETVLIYCDAVSELSRAMNTAKLQSSGLRKFREYLKSYVRSSSFVSLKEEAQNVKLKLSNVNYCIIIKPGMFTVKPYEGEKEYSPEIEKVFSRFNREKCADEFQFDIEEGLGMSHIEARILEFVSRLYPEPFTTLDLFCERNGRFTDKVILNFEREIQFYLSYLDFMEPLRKKGLPFCYPEVSSDKSEYVEDAFDIALASGLLDTRQLVFNDFYLENSERVIGQLHYLAALGLPIPARRARLFLPDAIFTHFEREERVQDQMSKLENDILRVKDILESTSSESLIILNEIFSSAALSDALFLSKEIMKTILERDCLCVWVTFLDELSRMNEKIVSMVATVSPQDPAVRTFKIIRKPADGRSYAVSLAEKYGLTYWKIRERVEP